MLFEKLVLDLAEQRRSAPMLSGVFAWLSKLYHLGLVGRHIAYQKKWLPTYAIPLPTVSIGNLVVGGTGKTPLVQKLAHALQLDGPIAILTRGYRSQAEKSNQPICIRKEQDAALCGDEPLLLARTTLASVWVGADRVASAQAAQAAGAACLILDDGFQHRRLSRDIDIVVVDANNPLSRGRFLPYGLLRDLPERLKSVDLIVATHTRDAEHYTQVKNELAAYTQAPVVAMRHVLVESLPLTGRSIGAFCGIGKPHYFFEALQQAGAEIVKTHALQDHGEFTVEEFKTFIEECREKGATDIVCTEKDWVKLEPKQGVHPIAMRLEIVAGQEHWDALVANIQQKIKVKR